LASCCCWRVFQLYAGVRRLKDGRSDERNGRIGRAFGAGLIRLIPMAISFRAARLRAFVGTCLAMSWRVVGRYALSCFDLRRFAVNKSFVGSHLSDVLLCHVLLGLALPRFALLCIALSCYTLLCHALLSKRFALLCFDMPCFDWLAAWLSTKL
jgi:hypothetical protein